LEVGLTLVAPPRQIDHEQLSASVEDLKLENRAAAARRQRLVEFYRRRIRAEQRRGATDDPTHLNARQETEVEVSALWAIPASWVRRQLNDAVWVDEHFPYLCELAADGRIDPYRVRLIAETARQDLHTEVEYAEIARKLEPYLGRHLRPDGIVACSHKQLRNKLAYEIRKLRAADAELRFRQALEGRDVVVSDGADGVSWLTIGGRADQIQLAWHRLTLTARAMRSDGDQRSIDQLRADLALDLLVNGASTPDAHYPVPSYARPIVNLTVPIQTVMGISDHPGALSGGQVIPAGLARMIAQQPGATWHRMLTDPAGRAVEVSAERYRPTRTIWEQVVGAQSTCFRPACDAPSTVSDLDHRIAWPAGPTDPSNLGPACRTDHRAKHASGFSIEQTASGGFTFSTAAGFHHDIIDSEHPCSDEWPDLPEPIQFSATEFGDVLAYLRERRAEVARRRPDLYWEHDLYFGINYDPAAA